MSIDLKEKNKWDPFKRFLIVAAAFIVSRFPYRPEKRKIVLVGGNLGEKYEDNSSVYHKYLINNHQDQVIAYWMYDAKTTYAKEERIQNAVPLGSFRNYLLFFRADFTFHGHSLMYDIAPSCDKFLFLNRKTVITHISHGIEGFKKILIQKEDIPLLKRTNYFNCASQYEYDLKRNKWKIPEEKLIITGFPRFDRYPPNQPPEKVRNILMMMTWREWLYELSEEEFVESDYFKSTMEIIGHQGIKDLFKSHGVQMTVALHPFMKKFEKHFEQLTDPDNGVKFLDFNHSSIERSIQENDLLLTDITSVSWDFLYLNKPIIFYMFDEAEYLSRRGTYLNLNTDLYGYKALDVDDVYTYLRKTIEEGVTHNEWYSKVNDYVDYFDQNNCQRLTKRVLNV